MQRSELELRAWKHQAGSTQERGPGSQGGEIWGMLPNEIHFAEVQLGHPLP